MIEPLALYGYFRYRPFWIVKYRGLNWLSSGFCPCCYSSPPRDDCPICLGHSNYGPNLHDETRALWRTRWLQRCKEWKARATG